MGETFKEKSWGTEIIVADTELYGCKILNIKKDKSIHLQHHESKDETMYIYKGIGYIAIVENKGAYGTCCQVNPGESFRIKPKKIHKVWAHTDMIIIEACNKIDDKDVVHHETFD